MQTHKQTQSHHGQTGGARKVGPGQALKPNKWQIIMEYDIRINKSIEKHKILSRQTQDHDNKNVWKQPNHRHITPE